MIVFEYGKNHNCCLFFLDFFKKKKNQVIRGASYVLLYNIHFLNLHQNMRGRDYSLKHFYFKALVNTTANYFLQLARVLYFFFMSAATHCKVSGKVI